MNIVEELFEKHKAKNVRWRIYPNPMRNDGVFVAEDKQIEPSNTINMEGVPYYPATPTTKHEILFQLPLDIAELLVKKLNVY